MYDIIIVGAGTAGMSAAIYGVRAGKSVLMIEAASYGGQIINTPDIANYPGIKNTSGYEFAAGLYDQATSLGAEYRAGRVDGIKDLGREKAVTVNGEDIPCKAVILATGAKNRPLGLEHETEWIGAGISYCATCDGMFYRNKTVAVNGGGNTALEDAFFLSNYCKKVYLIHRREGFRGEEKQLEALRERENVEFILNTTISALLGENRLTGLELNNVKTGEKSTLEVNGLFIAIGQMPENAAFADVVDLDPAGYIVGGEDCLTSAPGIFVAGDCRTKTVRQLTTAAADGAVAALAACGYIDAM